MLMDKGYYDYDYEAVKTKAKRHENSEKRTQDIMNRFGFGKVKSLKKPLTPEQLQAEVMREEEKKRRLG